MVATNIDEPLLLGNSGIPLFCPKIHADSEYLCSSGAIGENQASKKQKLVYKRTLYFRRRLQKSGPTRRQNCRTVYFPIVIEKTYDILRVFNYLGKHTVLQ